MTGKNKTALYYDIRLCESLWIAKEKCGPGHGLNEDWGGHLRTRAWLPLFEKVVECSVYVQGRGRAFALFLYFTFLTTDVSVT